LPKYVDAALREGFTITHKGLLVWAPLPKASDVPMFRAIFLVLEAALTSVFWAVQSKVTGESKFSFGILPLCPWNVSDLVYTGLCSHTPLVEQHTTGDVFLPVADLEELAETRHRKMLAQKNPVNKQNFAKNRETKRFYCADCDYSAAHQKNLDVHFASKRHFRIVTGTVAKTGNKSKKRVRIIANKKYYCVTCDYAAAHNQNLATHFRSPKHLQMVGQISSESSD
jgi:RNase P subunit RPR2